jgi:hypothetical protein
VGCAASDLSNRELHLSHMPNGLRMLRLLVKYAIVVGVSYVWRSAGRSS